MRPLRKLVEALLASRKIKNILLVKNVVGHYVAYNILSVLYRNDIKSESAAQIYLNDRFPNCLLGNFGL